MQTDSGFPGLRDEETRRCWSKSINFQLQDLVSSENSINDMMAMVKKKENKSTER